MFKHTFVSLLLVAAFSGCATEKFVGSAYIDGGEEADGSDGQSEPELLVAASASLEGSWTTPANPFQAIGIGPPYMTIRFAPITGTAGGTYRAVCPEACSVRGAVIPAGFVIDRGDYTLVDVTEKGQVRGAVFSEDFVFGIRFELGDPASSIPEQLFVEALPGFSFPLERGSPSGGPGPSPKP